MVRHRPQRKPGQHRHAALPGEEPEALRVVRRAGPSFAVEVEPDRLRQWYVANDVLNVPGEVILDETGGVDSTTQLVIARIGKVSPKSSSEGARFLLGGRTAMREPCVEGPNQR